jgi:two-component system sensor histidine kinase KdpD
MAPVRSRGVLVLQLRAPQKLRVPEERRLLDACASQIALALERVHFVEVAQQTQIAMEGERMRNTLLSAVSHDLRTPLTGILGAAQAACPMRRRAGAHMLVQIRNQAQALQQLVDNLLAMARLQQGGVQLKREWLPVDELVGSALAQMRERLAAHVLQTALPADLPLLQLDAVLMERVLVNLLDNAIKYTPEGTTITVAASVEGGDCVLSVQDAGPGLPAHLSAQQLFEPFTRGQAESAVFGMGLGLALAQRIVQAHGGSWRWKRRSPGRAPFSACACPCPSSRPWTNEPTIPCTTRKPEHDERRTPHSAD